MHFIINQIYKNNEMDHYKGFKFSLDFLSSLLKYIKEITIFYEICINSNGKAINDYTF